MNYKHAVIGTLAGLMVGTALTVSAGTWVNAYRNDEIKVTLNGVKQTFKDATTGEVELPLTYNDRTYLPLRSLANLVGVDVDYDANSKTAILNSKEEIVKNKTSFKDNFADNERIGNVFILNYQATLVEDNGYSHVKEDSVEIDWYFLKNELEVFGKNQTITFNNKVIKDIKQYNNTSLTKAYAHPGETIEYDSGLIILFEDGTIGKIKVLDIINGRNNIELFENINNVEWLCEGSLLHTDIGKNLYGVDNAGNVVFSYHLEPAV